MCVEWGFEAMNVLPKKKRPSQLAPRIGPGEPLAHPQEVRDTSAPRMGKALLLACSAALAVGMLEIGVRAFVPVPFGTNAAHRFVLDRDVIYRLRPSVSARWSTAEFTETSHTNALGLRGPEVAPKRPGEHRILAIGDSFTYGHGVGDDETYPAVLATVLRPRLGDVTALNAGVPGYSTDQTYTFFLRHGAALEADLLLVGVHCSDVSDNYESSLYDVRDGRLIPRNAHDSHLYRMGAMLNGVPALLQRSRLFDVLVASFDWHDGAGARPAVPDLDAWSREKIRLEMLALRARTAALSMQLGVVLMPCKKAVDPAAPNPYGTLGDDLDAEGVPVLEATAGLRQAHGDLRPLFFRADPHLDVDGNRLLAEVVADFIVTRRLLP
jgi:hypothetical protein